MRYTILFLFILSFFSINAYAQNENAEMEEHMKTWKEYMTPGSMHDMMTKNIGEWDIVSKFWMDPNSSEPTVSNAVGSGQMILGGRYLKMTYEGNVMGMPMEGFSLEGFDNGKQEFQNIWIDNMGTGMAYSTGKYDAVNKKVDYIGTMYDAMAGKDTEFRSVMKFNDDGTMVFLMYGSVDGKEYLMMEQNYTKKK